MSAVLSTGSKPSSRQSLTITAALLLCWLLSLLSLLSLTIDQWPWWGLVAAVLLRTQLHTGLFIISHDAMHRVLWPAQPRWNDRLGALALALYAGLHYPTCRMHHQAHHRSPATPEDPDFSVNQRFGPLGWYYRFLTGYLSAGQMCWLLAGWAALAHSFLSVTPTAVVNVLLFCTLPLLLSSLQLFIVGTYLPHRRQQPPWSRSQPDSLDWPNWLSFLACFHFGYHYEHHANPGLPWFSLPGVRQRALSSRLP